MVGGYVGLADATPLTAGRREALMLSDGIALPETLVAVDLSNFSSYNTVYESFDRGRRPAPLR